MALDPPSLPEFTSWPTFPFEGDFRVRPVDPPADEEPPRQGEDPATCIACQTPDSEYVWVSARWRVRGLDRPTGLPVVLILESRTHMDLGDLPNLLAAELGVMTVRLERAIRSLEGVGRVQVNRWGDGSAHLHLWFLARPYGQLQLRGTFLSLWDDILPPVPEETWRENLAYIGAWLAEFGGKSLIEAPHIAWKASLNFDKIEREASVAAAATARAGAEARAEALDAALAAEDPAVIVDEAEPADRSPGRSDHAADAEAKAESAVDTAGPMGGAEAGAKGRADHAAVVDSTAGMTAPTEGVASAERTHSGASEEAAPEPAEAGAERAMPASVERQQGAASSRARSGAAAAGKPKAPRAPRKAAKKAAPPAQPHGD